jgi:hypothetical protein
MKSFILAAALMALAPLAPAAAQTAVAGTYRGEMFSNGALQPTDTVFVEKNGSFAGSYVIHDPEDGEIHGKISAMTLDPGGRTYSFTWTDSYGSDAATVAFAPDGGSFTGKWFVDGRPVGVWNGTRAP